MMCQVINKHKGRDPIGSLICVYCTFEEAIYHDVFEPETWILYQLNKLEALLSSMELSIMVNFVPFLNVCFLELIVEGWFLKSASFLRVNDAPFLYN